jgi:hypothetical protein
MQKTIRVYRKTGFDGINIPSNQTVVETASVGSKNYTGYFIREDIDCPIIRINDTYDNLKDVDYVSISSDFGPDYTPEQGTKFNEFARTKVLSTETMFYFAIPKALSPKTTAIYLELDALTTMGGAENVYYESGWQTRGHVSEKEDVLFSNVADEDFMPSQELQIKNMQTVDADGGGGDDENDEGGESVNRSGASIDRYGIRSFVVTSTNLSDFYTGSGTGLDDFKAYASRVIEGKVNASDPEAKMYWPFIRCCSNTTTFQTVGETAGANNRSFSLPSTCVYDYDNQDVKDALNKLYSIGQLSLQSSYNIPGKWLTNPTESTDHHFATISGVFQQPSTSIKYKLPDTLNIRNNKCHAMFRKVALQSVASGDLCIKKISEVYDGIESGSIGLCLWSDPSFMGKPYARFSNINSAEGTSQMLYDGCVKGTQWINNQIVFEGASGGVWESINTGFANASAQRGYDQYMTNLRAQHEKTTRWAQYEAAMYPYEQMQQGMNVASGIAGTVMQAAQGNVGGAINGVMGTVSSAIDMGKMMTMKENVVIPNFQTDLNLNKANSEFEQQKLQQQINENAIGQLRNNNLVAPTVMFSPDANLSLYGINYFIVYETRMADSDIQALDDYFDRFGYSGLHRPLVNGCFDKRSKFNYVQAYDVSIRSDFPMRVRQKGVAQLNAGVRAWKVKPATEHYSNNPSVAPTPDPEP